MKVKMRVDRDGFVLTESVVVELSGDKKMVNILKRVIENLAESREWIVK